MNKVAKLKNFNGRFCESDFENALINLLENEEWTYIPGDTIPRDSLRETLYIDDLEQFLSKAEPKLTIDDIRQVTDKIRLVGAESDFAALHLVYGWMVDGVQIVLQNGKACNVPVIDFDRWEENNFRVVNQFTVEYTDNGQTQTRRPDILLFVNGLPVCIMELKNPGDEKATVYDAWEQINIRYWRDIPHLLKYAPLACISDGVKTRLGTVRTPYEHFYAWRRVEAADKLSATPYDELSAMVRGVYRPQRFLEIFRDYIYFQDSRYDKDEFEIVCRYPQFFAVGLLKESIIKSVESGTGKGGTYFGATGCGKTYTMAFLTRQLSMRCENIPAIGSPTVIMIVDRDELQKQGARLFTKSSEFLGLGEVSVVPNRKTLRQELSARKSGGFFICTIQKFCDRKEDKIGLLSERSNIICFSDEAHRTQIERAKDIKFGKDENENMKAMLSKPYAEVLREALPHATFVGFTGTPVDATYQTFGAEVDRYTMDQAVADGITVPIKYHPRIARVLLDEKRVKEIEDYYLQCADSGATADDIAASKKAMSSMEIILGEKSRLERLATDIHDHYLAMCASDPERVQKAMITCSTRPIAYELLKIFQEKYPDWFVPRRAPQGTKIDEEELAKFPEISFMAMVTSVGSNDPVEMYQYLGGTKNKERNTKLEESFKLTQSNFRIVIVVDMWITGFDEPTLTYLYNDKPLQRHQLIQTISRVNRKYPGKDYGLVVDYIGIRDEMRKALKLYGGEGNVAPTADDVEQAKEAFREHLEIIKRLFAGYNLSVFLNPKTDPVERYRALAQAAEYVFVKNQMMELVSEDGKKTSKVSFKRYFLAMTKRMRSAFAICQPSGVLNEEESALTQCFGAIAGFVRKMSGTTELDTDVMNRHVEKMVQEALKYNKVESILAKGEQEDIFGAEFTAALAEIKMPASKLELLIKMMKKGIAEYKKTNLAAGKKYQEMLEETIKRYHERRKKLTEEEAGETQEQASEAIIREATEQAMKIMREMQADRNSFRKINLTFEEKAFYDILLQQRDEANFEYGEDKELDGIIINEKCRSLAKKIKEIIDTKSSFSDWLNNQNVRDQLKFDIKICLVKNGYPPQYSPEVFRKVMEQVENFKGHQG